MNLKLGFFIFVFTTFCAATSSQAMLEACPTSLGGLTADQFTTASIQSFIKFYKSPKATPSLIQTEAARVVREIALTKKHDVLSAFLIELDLIKPPTWFRQPLRFRKYGTFNAFDSINEFCDGDGNINLPGGISKENRLVLLSTIARHLDRDAAAHFRFGSHWSQLRSRIFSTLISGILITDPLIANIKEKDVPEWFKISFLLKKRLASAVVGAYVQQYNSEGGVGSSDKLVIFEGLKNAIFSFPQDTEDYKNDLIRRMGTYPRQVR